MLNFNKSKYGYLLLILQTKHAVLKHSSELCFSSTIGAEWR